jgi:8-oxo-dGTP diphosphatase
MILNEKTKKWESEYWHPAVTTDAVVFGFDGEHLNVLLIERGGEPFKGAWALPGGFITPKDESAEAAVYRELNEETNVEGIYLEELQTFSKAGRDPRERVITIAFFALVVKDQYKIKGGDDARIAKWFPIDDLPQLAFDHNEIIQVALERLQQRIHFEPIGFHLLDKEFTMPQLQNIYIAILNPPADDNKLRDRRNFPKKMLKLGYIKETGKKVTGNPYRSPKLYTFDEEAYKNAKKIGMRLEF